MSERRPDWPFPTPPYRGEGTHPADIEPQTSWSRGGLDRPGAVVKRLDHDAAELAAWWAETRPTLDGDDLEPDERRRHLRHARTLAWMVSIALEGLGETVTHMAACDAMAGADDELASLIDHAMCWDFIWLYRQEDATAAAATRSTTRRGSVWNCVGGSNRTRVCNPRAAPPEGNADVFDSPRTASRPSSSPPASRLPTTGLGAAIVTERPAAALIPRRTASI